MNINNEKRLSSEQNIFNRIVIALFAVNFVFTGYIFAETKTIKDQNKSIIENQANIQYELTHIEPEDVIRYVYTDAPKTEYTYIEDKTDIVETETVTETELIETEITETTEVAEETELETFEEEVETDVYSSIDVSEVISDSKNNEEIERYSIPSGDTSFKSYMNYKCLSSSSAQGKLQKNAWTDEYGLRRVGDDYCVAVGSYYSTTIGERFEVEFDDGEIITVIVGDCKQDCHTDSTNRYRNVYDSYGNHISKNVLEFIVDTSVLHKKSKQMGTVSEIEHLSGNIVRITKITME